MPESIEKYGRKWSIEGGTITDLDIELLCFRDGRTKAQGGLGKEVHFRRCVSFIWPEFDWNPWAQFQAQALCEFDYVGFTGCANSGKSGIMSVWGLVNWFADPVHTSVIATSTTTVDAKKKVWADVVKRYRTARSRGMAVGRLVDSFNIIKLPKDVPGASNNSSISLAAAGDEYKNEALRKLQGVKNHLVILLLDEFQDCSHDILDNAAWNLVNNPRLQICAAGNAGSKYDPHGKFCEPKDGWNSITIEDEFWEIEVLGRPGIALHFDAEKTPNLEDYDPARPDRLKYPYLAAPKAVEIARREKGATSAQFYRQYRGFWPEEEDEDVQIYTASLITRWHGEDRPYWKEGTEPHDVLGIDPAYTGGGDRFIAMHLQYGITEKDLWTICFKDYYDLRKTDDQTEDDFQYAMIREIVKLKNKLGVKVPNIGVDASAGGIFWSIGEREGLQGWLPVKYGGAASDSPIYATDDRPAKELFYNRTSELSFVGRLFLENNQLRGINPALAWEFVHRQYTRSGKDIVKVEGKGDMKKRIGKSPDLMDAANIGIEVCRLRFGATAGGAALVARQAEEAGNWKQFHQTRTQSVLSEGSWG